VGEGIPYRFEPGVDTARVLDDHGALVAGEESGVDVTVAGRLMLRRLQGRLAFGVLQDSSGRIQLFAPEKTTPDFAGFTGLHLGDWVGVTGEVLRTKRGELSVRVDSWVRLAEARRPFPDKWHGIADVNTRYRQRYVDLWVTEEARRVFVTRSHVVSWIRRWLEGHGFMEVETPVFHPIPGGALARPFATHHQALDMDLYLRVAPELYLKRLIIGGFDKVYEIGRVFRNEGIDQDHNPEFTLLESYEAYADYNDIMEMVEQMVSTIAIEVNGSTKVAIGEDVIDFAPPWQRVSLREELEKRSGVDLESYNDDALRQKAGEVGIDTKVLESRGRLIDKLLSTFVEPRLIQPTFVLDYPEEMSPLAKAKPDSPGYVERFEAFAFGMEIANSYSELNDPKVQRERFEAQAQIQRLYENEEVDRQDDDFLTAMEYGMPPTGGLGIGIDRLVMLLAGQPSIRDVLLFPQMRTMPSDQATQDAQGEPTE